MSGKSLSENEHVLEPTISVEVVSDPTLIRAARMGLTDINKTDVVRPSQIFSCPASAILKPSSAPDKSYVLYQHIFGGGATYPNDGWFYIGITTRKWQKRWSEHRRAIEKDSPLLFHRRYRDEVRKGSITYVHHKIMGITDNIEALYYAEEAIVEGHWNDERRLNMVPGGKSALHYMRENGILSSNSVPTPDERDGILRRWLEEHPRKGLPAPWVSERWKDDEWAIAQICGRDDRLSVEQVKAIRRLANNHSAELIATRIGARNIAQVKNVIAGKTYTRIQ